MAKSSNNPASGTEARDNNFQDLAQRSGPDIMAAILTGQYRAVDAARAAIPEIDHAVQEALARLSGGDGRLIYTGAGTSGRLGALDGAELPPTFSWPIERVRLLMAGGEKAITRSVEGAEDDQDAASAAVAKMGITNSDVVIGIAASGTTPFTRQVLRLARKNGALTIAIANNPAAPMLGDADISILLETGPEVLAGSTRLSAGTSQKIALNLFSTSLMIGMNKIYQGHMVDMVASNDKLQKRAVKIVCDITGCGGATATRALNACNFEIKLAILFVHGVEPAPAREMLALNGGNLAKVIAQVSKSNPS